jgi:predicted nucleotidyltransferase
MESVLEERKRDVLRDKKWLKFLRQAKWFRHLPFIELVFGTGSMAVGNIKEDSDFDVLIRTRVGRIFTARFFSKILFGILGLSRKPRHGRSEQKDKICLSHFFTREVKDPGLPYDKERAVLHLYLVPLFGSKEEMKKFFAGLEKVEKKRSYEEDLRHFAEEGSFIKKWGEKILKGKMGDKIEKILRRLQIKKIERKMKGIEISETGIARYTDQEIKFHY